MTHPYGVSVETEWDFRRVVWWMMHHNETGLWTVDFCHYFKLTTIYFFLFTWKKKYDNHFSLSPHSDLLSFSRRTHCCMKHLTQESFLSFRCFPSGVSGPLQIMVYWRSCIISVHPWGHPGYLSAPRSAVTYALFAVVDLLIAIHSLIYVSEHFWGTNPWKQ